MRRVIFRASELGNSDVVRRGALLSKPKRGPVVALALGGTVLIVAIAVAMVAAVYASRDRAISASKRELEKQCAAAVATLRNALGVKSVAAEIELAGIGSPGVFERTATTAAVHRMLALEVMGARELVG